jgi:hypothetical protein
MRTKLGMSLVNLISLFIFALIAHCHLDINMSDHMANKSLQIFQYFYLHSNLTGE